MPRVLARVVAKGDGIVEQFFKYTKASEDRCSNCKFRKLTYTNGGWSFYGCCHEPYKGKWIAEIKDCPRKGAETIGGEN